ncbi:hypothetical protein D9615_010479 [Tricholomella constricta]|uniref:Uncharacterized protein n=1 Tax=Tricholomella constricta TaxID=117010 RepID=A0A8H5LSK2_9AGAR|nr:hypothetical protein D9615_010479 [Tricholomella constricta]
MASSPTTPPCSRLQYTYTASRFPEAHSNLILHGHSFDGAVTIALCLLSHPKLKDRPPKRWWTRTTHIHGVILETRPPPPLRLLPRYRYARRPLPTRSAGSESRTANVGSVGAVQEPFTSLSSPGVAGGRGGAHGASVGEYDEVVPTRKWARRSVLGMQSQTATPTHQRTNAPTHQHTYAPTHLRLHLVVRRTASHSKGDADEPEPESARRT